MSNVKKSFYIDGQRIDYRIQKRKGQKRLTLSVCANGKVLVTIPKWTPFYVAESFIRKKRGWIEKVVFKTDFLNKNTADEKHYKKHKEEARSFIKKRLIILNKNYGFVYNRISVRKNSTRWGSCSSLSNLNFDYRILFLEPELQDYLLVHELCHLKEMNHSGKFWKLVEKTIPDYKKRRVMLKGKKL
jgi:predicted metal-dependent hydrolase